MDCIVNNPGCIGESSQTVDCDHADKGRHCRILVSFTEVTCRYSDHGLQPSRALHTFHQGDSPSPLHPRESPSLAHADEERSLWRSLPWHLHQLSGAHTGSLVLSHWPRFLQALLSLVEIIVLLSQPSNAIKLKATKAPTRGFGMKSPPLGHFLTFVVFLWQKGGFWLPKDLLCQKDMAKDKENLNQ